MSLSTASIAFRASGPIATETRMRVLRAAERLGYAGPDPRGSSLRRGRSGVVAIVFDQPFSQAVHDSIVALTLEGIAEGLGVDSNGLLLLTRPHDRTVDLASASIDAAVLMGRRRDADSDLAALRHRGVPVVAVGPPMAGERSLVTIDIDDRSASARLARHLRELGHTRVGVIALAPDEFSGTSGERLAGVREVYPGARVVAATGSTVADGLRAAQALLSSGSPHEPVTAIVAQSDRLALGAVRAARAAGLDVPRNLSIAGFDGAEIEGAELDELTTMVQPAYRKGCVAGRAVAALLAGEPATSIRLECELRLGTTTAAAP